MNHLAATGTTLRASLACLAFAAALLSSAGSAQAAFPGVDGAIAFSSNRDTGAGDLYTVRPGGSIERLTTSTSSSDPAYSPDGTRVAFVNADNQIAVMSYQGTGRTVVTSTSTAKQQPSWSPDGTRIAYAANSFDVDGQTDREIWAIDADGTDRVQLTSNTVEDTEPAWSPDGSKLAFVSARAGDNNRNVYVMNADGGGQTDLTQDEEGPGCNPNCYAGHDDSPAWSPDGATIAYTHSREVTGGGVPNVWTMNAAGTRASRTNISDSATSFVTPAWSPEGDRIAAVGTEDGSTDRDIWVMGADGSAAEAIDAHLAHDIDPDWQPITPPVCSAVSASGTAGQPAPVALGCVGVGPLGYAIVAPPASGQLSIPDAAGSLTYTPNPGFVGTDGFQYRASNVAGDSNVAAAMLSIAPAPPPAPPPAPSNDVAIEKEKLNKKAGTAILTVEVASPGSVELDGKNLKRVSESVAAPGPVRLSVKPAGKAKRKLKRKGKATVKPRIAFTPAGGTTATVKTKLQLVKKKRG